MHPSRPEPSHRQHLRRLTDHLCHHHSPLLLADIAAAATSQQPEPPRLRFGVTADAHLWPPSADAALRDFGRTAAANERTFHDYVASMHEWRPDLVVEMGDFGCQASNDPITTQAHHDDQLAALRSHVHVFSALSCPRYHVIGNHDVGWLRGGDEHITAQDLIGCSHPGEDITKAEFVEATSSPGRCEYMYRAAEVACAHFLP